MKIGRRRFIGAVASSAIVAPALWTKSRAQAKYTAKISTSPTADHPSTQGLYKLAELVKQRTDGAVELRVFPSAVLGGDAKVLQGMKLGSVEASCVPTSQFIQYVPDYAICDLPYVFRSSDQAQRAAPAIQKIFAPNLIDAGFHPVMTFNYGERGINGTFPVKTISDMRGRKIRVIESQTEIRTWQLLGANPTPLPSEEVYLALQTGVIEGVLAPASNYVSMKRYEVAKYYVKLQGLLNAIMLLSFSKSWIRKLPPDHVEILTKTAEELSPTIFGNCLKGDDEALEAAEKNGCTIVSIEDRDAWVNATEPVINAYVGKSPTGQKLLEQIRAIA